LRFALLQILFADDLGFSDVGFNGHPTVRTPNLDKAAFEGMRLTNLYSAAPVCS
jgi:arylsulfatase A-like enzyme